MASALFQVAIARSNAADGAALVPHLAGQHLPLRLIGGAGVPAYEVTRSFIDAGTVASILTDANNGENWFALGDRDKKLNELRDKIASAATIEIRRPLLDELQKHVLEQGYFIPRTQIVQRIYVQSPKIKGEKYNGVAYASYYTATKAK